MQYCSPSKVAFSFPSQCGGRVNQNWHLSFLLPWRRVSYPYQWQEEPTAGIYVSDLVKTGQSRNFCLTTWRYDLCWIITQRLEPGTWSFWWGFSSFLLGQKVLGMGLGEAGQNSLQTCGVWPHQYPAMWPESWGKSVTEGRKSSAHLLLWCLFCIYTQAGVLAAGP